MKKMFVAVFLFISLVFVSSCVDLSTVLVPPQTSDKRQDLINDLMYELFEAQHVTGDVELQLSYIPFVDEQIESAIASGIISSRNDMIRLTEVNLHNAREFLTEELGTRSYEFEVIHIAELTGMTANDLLFEAKTQFRRFADNYNSHEIDNVANDFFESVTNIYEVGVRFYSTLNDKENTGLVNFVFADGRIYVWDWLLF